MRISVIIPTYRRVEDLKRCLRSLNDQIRKADEIIVVVRDIDRETQLFLENFEYIYGVYNTIIVNIPGQVHALNQGIEQATGDIISITDDDGAPWPDWLKNVEEHFIRDARVGGVGGKDWLHNNFVLETGKRDIVGKIQWFGRVIGNHHLGHGTFREVDLLKGVNMSFRASAIKNIRFDERLMGKGAQVHNDMAFCLEVKRAGWKLIYDPNVALNHYLAERHDEDKRNQSFNYDANCNAVHNETLVLLEHLSKNVRVFFLVWAVLIGTRSSWGVAQLVRFYSKEKKLAIIKFNSSIKGRRNGWRTWKNSNMLNKRGVISENVNINN
ncbi:glycosyltransferase [Paenibacillus sp. p3-SID867]|uniref:glycosyltransferase family 2 protein n=1 Tax=Paenibacillus sp. p3-SID867 TaxID=2916363 RepID=UPI0021A94CCB|nr:glycosyltransferase [Paenibacillus sp. p3-SID867]MCT1400011.1 glycosyltransferase [Paenibacillus sp. p3-SID867]